MKRSKAIEFEISVDGIADITLVPKDIAEAFFKAIDVADKHYKYENYTNKMLKFKNRKKFFYDADKKVTKILHTRYKIVQKNLQPFAIIV